MKNSKGEDMRYLFNILMLTLILFVGACVPQQINTFLEDLVSVNADSSEQTDKAIAEAKGKAIRKYPYNESLSPYLNAYRQAGAAERDFGSPLAAIEIWQMVLPRYETDGWQYTRGVIYFHIASLYEKTKAYEKTIQFLDLSDDQYSEVKRTGLTNLNDDGQGARINDLAAGSRPDNAEREQQFNAKLSWNDSTRHQAELKLQELEKQKTFARSRAKSKRSSVPTYGMNPYQAAQTEAYYAEYERRDYKDAVLIWEDLLRSYEGDDWQYTRATILSKIGYLYSQHKEYGKALEYADRSDKLLAEVKRIGLSNIDDNGMGVRVSNTGDQYRISEDTRKQMFDAQFTTNDSVRWQYYKAAGDSKKAEELSREMSARSTNYDAYTSTYKATLESLKQQAKSNKKLTKEEMERQAREKAREAQEQYERMKRNNAEMTLLRAEIIRRGRAGNTNTDELIDRYVEVQLQQDFMVKSYETTAKIIQESQPDTARDYLRYAEYVKHNYLEPWGMAVKATLLVEAGRLGDALNTLDQASARFSSPDALPDFENPYSRQTMEMQLQVMNKDTLAWEFLRAQILTQLKDPRAIRAWDNVISEMNKPAADMSQASQQEKTAATTARIMRTAILGDRYQELAATEIAALHEKLGSRSQGLAYIDQILKSRETARASFSVEAHKRGYLAANKRLYERYLLLSADNPGNNLLGMERAKSRGMIDLMAGGIGNMDDPTLRMVARHRVEAAMDAERKADERPTRDLTLTGLDKGLEALRQQNPDLHALISVDVAGAEELADVLGPNTVALSYYVADNVLFINVIGQGTRKVVARPVARGALFGAVYDYRQHLLNPSYKPSRKGGSVKFDWTIDKGTQRMSVTNNMPFPLEIRGISTEYQSHATGGTFPYLPMGYSLQMPKNPLVDVVAPGKKAIILEEEQWGGNWTYSNYLKNYVETNLGTAYASGMVLSQEGKDDQLTVFEEHGFSYKPLGLSLYDVLIKPVEREITGKQLVIVPHSVLHFLPFESLKGSDGKYLIEGHPVSYAPSLNALRLCRIKSRSKPSRLVAYSDPLGDLVYARREVESIRPLFDESMILTGEQVTQPSVASTIDQGDVIHFACHGIFNPASPLDSALVMASKKSGQSLGRLTMEDLNLLTVGDIMRLKVNPSLVFLSACDTGRARVSGGDELIGLIRGFFVAGSPSLVTTLWPIDDESTALLVTRFYENLLKRNMDKSRALQDAKLYLMQHGFADPYYWAAFVLQGDWQ